MRFTIDASVHLNALNPGEDGSAESRALLERLHRRPWPVHSPTLLMVEVAGADYRLALAIVVLVVPTLSFAMNRIWVFSGPA